MGAGRSLAVERAQRIADGYFEVDVAVVDHARPIALAFTGDERRGAVYELLAERLCTALGWVTCETPRLAELRLPSNAGDGRITSSDELRELVKGFDEQRAERLLDVRQAHVERIRNGLLLMGEQAELAAHHAWELACLVENHAALAGALPLLLSGLASPHSRLLRARCAATLAMFAETAMAHEPRSTGGLPIDEIVRVIHGHFWDFIAPAEPPAAGARDSRASADAPGAEGATAAEGAAAAEAAAAAAAGQLSAALGALSEASVACTQLPELARAASAAPRGLERVDAAEVDELLMLLAVLLRSPSAREEHGRLDGDQHVLQLLARAEQDVRHRALAVLSVSLRGSACACGGFLSDGGCAALLAIVEDGRATAAVRASAASALGWVLRFVRLAKTRDAQALLCARVEPRDFARIAALCLAAPAAQRPVALAAQRAAEPRRGTARAASRVSPSARVPSHRPSAGAAAASPPRRGAPVALVEVSLLESLMCAGWAVAGMYRALRVPLCAPADCAFLEWLAACVRAGTRASPRAAGGDDDDAPAHEDGWVLGVAQMAGSLLANLRPHTTRLPLCVDALAIVERAVTSGTERRAGARRAAEPAGNVPRGALSVLDLDAHWAAMAASCASVLAQWSSQPAQHGLLGAADGALRLARILTALHGATAAALGGAPRAPPAHAAEALLYRNCAAALTTLVALDVLIPPLPTPPTPPVVDEPTPAEADGEPRAPARPDAAAEEAAWLARAPAVHVHRAEPSAELVLALGALLDPLDGACAYGACALWALTRTDERAALVGRCGVAEKLLALLRKGARAAAGQAAVSAWTARSLNCAAWAVHACSVFEPSARALSAAPGGISLLRAIATASDDPRAPPARACARLDTRVRAAATFACAQLCLWPSTAPLAVEAGVHTALVLIATARERDARERRACARALNALRGDERFKAALRCAQEETLIDLVRATDTPSLRCFGARELARIALGQRRQSILSSGGTRALLDAVHDSARAHAADEAAAAAHELPLEHAQLEVAAAREQLRAARARAALLLPKAACEESDLRALLPEALGALVNLSSEPHNQLWLAKAALWTLSSLLDQPPAGCVAAARLAAQVLSHLASNHANRKRMYCAEFKLKAKRWHEESMLGHWSASGSDDDEDDDDWNATGELDARPRVLVDFERWVHGLGSTEAHVDGRERPRPVGRRQALAAAATPQRSLKEAMCSSFQHMWMNWHAAALEPYGDDLSASNEWLSASLLEDDGASRAEGAPTRELSALSTSLPRPATAPFEGGGLGARPSVALARTSTALSRASASMASRSMAHSASAGRLRPVSAANQSPLARASAAKPHRGLSQSQPSRQYPFSATVGPRASVRTDASGFGASPSQMRSYSSASLLREPSSRWRPDIVLVERKDDHAAHGRRTNAVPAARQSLAMPMGQVSPLREMSRDPLESASAERAPPTPLAMAPTYGWQDAPGPASPNAADARADKQFSIVLSLDSQVEFRPIWTFERTVRLPLTPELLRERQVQAATARSQLRKASSLPPPARPSTSPVKNGAAKADGATDDEPPARRFPVDDSRFQMASWKATPGARYWRINGGQALDGPDDAPFGELELPGGELIRCYHKGVRRHVYHVPSEMDSVFGGEPLQLSDLGEATLPGPPRPPFPTERGKPPLRSHVHIAAPTPETRLLPGSQPDTWFGTLAVEPLLLIGIPCDPREAAKGVSEEHAVWTLDGSLFAPRRKTCDARAYFTTADVLLRGFELDWERCNSARFQRLVMYEDDDGELGLGAELTEVRTRLHAKCALLYSIYEYYCMCGSSYDGFTLSLNEFTLFCDDCAIAEPESKCCRQADLDLIFIAACPKDDVNAAQLKFDHALLRYQWLQVVVRVAIAKYVRTGRTRDVSDALEMLISRDIEPNISAYAAHDHDLFRREQFYLQDTELALLQYEGSLREIYRRYSAADNGLAADKGKRLALNEWMQLMSDTRMINDTHFTNREARLCFTWSTCFVADEMVTLTFTDFLEALGHLACFKPLPSERQIIAVRQSIGEDDDPSSVFNCASFFDALEQTKRSQSLEMFNKENRRDWQIEETARGRPLSESIELVCQLLIGRLDTDGDRMITKKDWKNHPAGGMATVNEQVR